MLLISLFTILSLSACSSTEVLVQESPPPPAPPAAAPTAPAPEPAVTLPHPTPQPTPSGPLGLQDLSREQLRVWLKGASHNWQLDTDQARGLPAPATAKALPEKAVILELPEPDLNPWGRLHLAEAIAKRRSQRDYADVPLRLEELGFLLWSAQGVSAARFNDDGETVRTYRTVPSAGGRYPLETYVLVRKVNGARPGLYRYRSRQHQLVLLRPGNLVRDLRAACYDSPSVGQAAATIIWTAVPYRTEWKYGNIAHRMIAMEAGHACQNLYLSATASNMGVCASLAYDQTRLDQFLGVDGEEEFTLYLATVGKPR